MSDKLSFLQSPVSRREALKATVLFSSTLLGGGWGRAEESPTEPRYRFRKEGVHVLAFGDYGSRNSKQKQVADRMSDFSSKLDMPPAAVLALGDNFYGRLEMDHYPERFENMYSDKTLACPFYATLGNHDYGPGYDSKQGRAKADMQLKYARDNPKSRWKMPAKWYSFEIGANPEEPMVKVIYLDGNYFEGAMTPQEKLDQKRWLEKEFTRETKAPWFWLCSHYPIFSDTTKRTDKAGAHLLNHWGEYVKHEKVSLYMAGHDHNLQHLKMDGYSPDFIVTGGGGASRYDITSSGRGFSMKTRGFTHINANRERMVIQFVNTDGELIHSFRRTNPNVAPVKKAAFQNTASAPGSTPV